MNKIFFFHLSKLYILAGLRSQSCFIFQSNLDTITVPSYTGPWSWLFLFSSSISASIFSKFLTLPGLFLAVAVEAEMPMMSDMFCVVRDRTARDRGILLVLLWKGLLCLPWCSVELTWSSRKASCMIPGTSWVNLCHWTTAGGHGMLLWSNHWNV